MKNRAEFAVLLSLDVALYVQVTGMIFCTGWEQCGAGQDFRMTLNLSLMPYQRSVRSSDVACREHK